MHNGADGADGADGAGGADGADGAGGVDGAGGADGAEDADPSRNEIIPLNIDNPTRRELNVCEFLSAQLSTLQRRLANVMHSALV